MLLISDTIHFSIGSRDGRRTSLQMCGGGSRPCASLATYARMLSDLGRMHRSAHPGHLITEAHITIWESDRQEVYSFEPLRLTREDVPGIVDAFAEQIAAQLGVIIPQVLETAEVLSQTGLMGEISSKQAIDFAMTLLEREAFERKRTADALPLQLAEQNRLG